MSGLYESTLDQLQRALLQHLQACSALRGIDIFDREVGDVEDKINVTLSQGVGATIFVSEVELGGISGDLANVSADDAQFVVAIYNNPTSNSTGRNSAYLREAVMRRLHHYQPTVPGVGVVTLVPDPENGRPRKATDVRDLTFRLTVTLEAGID
jgi:hypothetical protein